MNRYSRIPTTRGEYVKTPLYPDIPLSSRDIYAITEFGDRFELLASQFYGDTSLWWIIANANADKVDLGSMFLPEGIQIRIPLGLYQIIDSYNSLNNI